MSLHAFLVLSEVEFLLIGRFFSIGGKCLRIRSGCGMIKLWQIEQKKPIKMDFIYYLYCFPFPLLQQFLFLVLTQEPYHF